MSKTALITGITGQDGAYLADFLLSKGYEVYGLVRRTSTINLWRLEFLGIKDRVSLITGDVTDISSLQTAIYTVKPDEIYNLAAQSFVGVSWNQPHLTFDVNALGVLNLLEAAKPYKDIKIYQASTSEMFGNRGAIPLDLNSGWSPVSPYGIAKMAAHELIRNYRETYGMFAVSGVLFNHESPLRGKEFVTRKITDAVGQIVNGKAKNLVLGNLKAVRDWGHAKDYVRGMWMMLQQEKPVDFVLATGNAHSVEDFCHLAFQRIGMHYRDYVVTDSDFKRPNELHILKGDPSRAIFELGWEREYTFTDLVNEMVDIDVERHKK